jgi:hypothetical protein
MTFSERALGAARLDTRAFEDVEADRGATVQALAVVALSSLAAGVGLGIGIYDAPILARVFVAMVMWIVWAGLTLAIGVYLFPEPQTQSNVGELLRTIGFAATPGILRGLGFVPLVGGLIYLFSSLWMLVAMVVAVRQALDYTSTARAAAVCVIAWILAVIMVFIVLTLGSR